MDRTYVVTGAASGIGAATTRYLRERGGRVIGCDLHDADVVANLTTPEGRAELVDGVTRLSGGRIDGIVANAGGGPADSAGCAAHARTSSAARAKVLLRNFTSSSGLRL